jgi:hypothetical protein
MMRRSKAQRFRFTSLILVEERLREANYFVGRLAIHPDVDRFGYELNAFLSAARSVTFILQKELSDVPGFQEWWSKQRDLLVRDPAARFFLELRNDSQKEGRISTVGVALPKKGKRRRWLRKFAGTADPVPTELLNRDVVECCREHLAKLARVVLVCAETFPHHSCPRQALTSDGMGALGFTLCEVEVALGFPRGWSEMLDESERTRCLEVFQRHVDPVDFAVIRRIARPRARLGANAEADPFGEIFSSSLVHQIEDLRGRSEVESPVMAALAEQVLDT